MLGDRSAIEGRGRSRIEISISTPVAVASVHGTRPFGSTRPNSLRLYTWPSPSNAQPCPGHTSSSSTTYPSARSWSRCGQIRGALPRRPLAAPPHDVGRRPRPRPRPPGPGARHRASSSTSPCARSRVRDRRESSRSPDHFVRMRVTGERHVVRRRRCRPRNSSQPSTRMAGIATSTITTATVAAPGPF